MDLCAYVTWFGIFSVGGWIYECTFCAIKNRRWDNRGFLFGPVCPIYGVGGVSVMLLFDLLGHFFPATSVNSTHVLWWQIFLVCSIGSAVLEYATSYVLETFFHARWWDYSHMPLNIKGRICLPFTLCFGAAGTLGYYFLAIPVFGTTQLVPQIVWEISSLLITGLMCADLGLTVASLSDLAKRIEAAQADFDAIMEVAVADVASGRMLKAPARASAKASERARAAGDWASERARAAGDWASERARAGSAAAFRAPETVEAYARRAAQSLSVMQKRTLRVVNNFSSEKRDAAAQRLRAAAESASARASKYSRAHKSN